MGLARCRGDETHIEGDGPEGGVILLSMMAVNGVVHEILDDDLGIGHAISLDDFRRGLEKQRLAREAAIT